MCPENQGRLASSVMNLYELKKLKSLSFKNVVLDSSFFNDKVTRFSCLTYLSLDQYLGYASIQIASTLLKNRREIKDEEYEKYTQFGYKFHQE